MSNDISVVNASHHALGPGRIAFVQSCWHRDIVDECRDAFLAAMSEHGVLKPSITLLEVPGAFELPLQAKLLALTGGFDIVVAAGFVVDGGIYRHEFVAAAVVDALMALQLELQVPVISVVLTPWHFHEHDAHSAFFRNHMMVKGREAADACIITLRNVQALKSRACPADLS